ncbi:hypothetical protein [Paenibacillus silvisoli]|uniref:hypothetical protein n=1 Tax=Paenibacillus silvisoli TaxID=3110539 RepID=UPI0028053D14|nr:hypothetical protein [Paenibacillus silvisoli]
MLLEQRARLDAVLAAVEETERLATAGEPSLEAVARLIAVMQTELKPVWLEAYLTPDEQATVREIAARAYSPEQLGQLAKQPFAEESFHGYRRFRAELARLVAEGADPTGPEAVAVARQLTAINERRMQGDPAIAAGMKRAWAEMSALPADKRPPLYALSAEEQAFIRAACIAMYRG